MKSLPGFFVLAAAASSAWLSHTQPTRVAANDVNFAAALLNPAQGHLIVAKSTQNACALLPFEDLSAETGITYVKAQDKIIGNGESSCTYVPGTTDADPIVLTISYRDGNVAMNAILNAEPYMTQNFDMPPSPDGTAYFFPLDSSVYALRGDVLINMRFGLGNETRELKKKLVAKVLSAI